MTAARESPIKTRALRAKAEKASMPPTCQYRFVRTTLMVAPAVSQEIKYLAVHRMEDGKLAVLAQVSSYKKIWPRPC